VAFATGVEPVGVEGEDGDEDEGEDEDGVDEDGVADDGFEPAAVADCAPLCWAFALLPEPDPHPVHQAIVAKTNKTLKNRSVAVFMKSPGQVFGNLARDYVGVGFLDISYTAYISSAFVLREPEGKILDGCYVKMAGKRRSSTILGVRLRCRY